MTSVTLTSRPYAGESDLQAITDLLNFVDSVDKLNDNYSLADLRTEFSDPDTNPAKDLRLWHTEDGQLIAFGQTYLRTDAAVIDASLYFRIHPDYREVWLEDEIMAWAETRLRAEGQERDVPVDLRGWGPEHYQYMFDILQRHGMKPVRHFFRMKRPLDAPIPPLQLPEGYTLRHVATLEDQERWVDAFNWSFIDHYNHHPRTLESHRHWLNDPNYQPERDLIAVTEDGTVAAFAFCTIDQAGNERNNERDGWVNMLGVRRGHRKIGLGKAMLIAGLHRLKADGMQVAKLGVDAENPTGALQLYESVGFERDMTSVSWMKRL